MNERHASEPPAEHREEPRADEFSDLLESLGAGQTEGGPDPDRVLALKQMEVDALREQLVKLSGLGVSVAEVEKRFLAEKAQLEHQIAGLHRTLLGVRGSAVRRRAIFGARRRELVARLRATRDELERATERLAEGKERYQRRRADVDKLRREIQKLTQEAKERGAEVRAEQRRVRELEAELESVAKWRARVEKQVRGLVDERPASSRSRSARPSAAAKKLAALFDVDVGASTRNGSAKSNGKHAAPREDAPGASPRAGGSSSTEKR